MIFDLFLLHFIYFFHFFYFYFLFILFYFIIFILLCFSFIFLKRFSFLYIFWFCLLILRLLWRLQILIHVSRLQIILGTRLWWWWWWWLSVCFVCFVFSDEHYRFMTYHYLDVCINMPINLKIIVFLRM